MDNEVSNNGSARDVFLYDQIKGNKSLYRGIAVVYALATIAAAVMAIAALALGRSDGGIGLILVGLIVGTNCMISWSHYKGYSAALEEIGPSPKGVDTCRTYSARTASYISKSRKDSNTLLQLWIAYGIMAVIMIGMGILLALLMLESKEYVLAAIGAGLTGGGALLLFMAIKAFRDWTASKRLEATS